MAHLHREKPDATMEEIKPGLEKRGFSVFLVAAVGGIAGLADAIAGRHGLSHLVEAKRLGGRLSSEQITFCTLRWRGCYHWGTSSEQIAELLYECEKRHGVKGSRVRPG